MNGFDFITLKNGISVPVPVIRLALDLENRGIALRVDGHELLVGPSDRLTDDDRVAIRRWRSHLVAVVDCAERTAIH